MTLQLEILYEIIDEIKKDNPSLICYTDSLAREVSKRLRKKGYEIALKL